MENLIIHNGGIDLSYLIFADVSIDIDKKFASENSVRYIPMEYTLGDDIFYCVEPESDEMMHNYYEKLRNKIKTQTTQITPNKYMDIFEPLVKDGKDILYLSLSGGLSSTYESALLAVQNLCEDYPDAKIEVVDSLGATGGMGLLIESAVNNKANGIGLKENAEWLRENALNVNFWFKVEDLMYLMRGGRVSATTAIVGTALSIKPILTIDANGKLITADKKRGNKQAMKSLIEKFRETYNPKMGKTVYISCADCMDDANALKEMVLAEYPDLEIRITMLSPIIGAHTGPDMLALIYYGEKRVN